MKSERFSGPQKIQSNLWTIIHLFVEGSYGKIH